MRPAPVGPRVRAPAIPRRLHPKYRGVMTLVKHLHIVEPTSVPARYVHLAAIVAWAAIALMGPAASRAQEPAPTVQPSEGGTIDIRANQAKLEDVLQQLAEATDQNIVIGAGVDGRRITVSVKNMTLLEVLEAVLPGAGCGYRDYGNHVLVDSLDVLTAGEPVAQERLEVRVVPLKYTSARDMLEMVQPLVSEVGRIVATPEPQEGIGGDEEETGGDSIAAREVLIIEEAPERLDQIMHVIRSIDVAPRQVLVEATILRSVLDDDNQLGVEINFLGGVDFETVKATSVGGKNLIPGLIPRDEYDDGIASVTTLFGGPTSPEGFTFGLIKNNLAVFIRALEELTDTVVLASPKILTLNKQKGQFIVGRRDGYTTTTVTETAAVEAIEFLETGTRLAFRPFVLDDDRVRMEVHVEDSAGGLTQSDLPFENTTESTSNIIVEDGHTIFIGGLFRNSTDVSRSQLPGLGEIPGLGAAFRRSHDESQREEVIVLLTVHVIKDDPLYHELGDRMLSEANEIRLAARERMQWFGRQRLADAHLQSAIENLNAGRRDQALFHTRMALSASPTTSLARRLRRQLVSGADAIGPNLDLRNWVARQLNQRPATDRVTGQPMKRSAVHSPGVPVQERAAEGGNTGD